jgi:hypothetical protein
MNIKQMGDFLEIECCGCGEALLVGDGDKVNVRIGTTNDAEGNEVEIPDGFLCSVCHKEQGTDQSFVKIQRKKCFECGKDGESDENFYPKFNDDGEFRGFFCSDCF